MSASITPFQDSNIIAKTKDEAMTAMLKNIAYYLTAKRTPGLYAADFYNSFLTAFITLFHITCDESGIKEIKLDNKTELVPVIKRLLEKPEAGEDYEAKTIKHALTYKEWLYAKDIVSSIRKN